MTDEEYAESRRMTDACIQAGTLLALDEHRRMGRSIVNWEDGKMIVRTGEEIPVRLPDEAHRYPLVTNPYWIEFHRNHKISVPVDPPEVAKFAPS